ncbi:uncharacterized protein LOC134773182 [Penaeus indicus]|uniref:uncharacterized protein LOC134773182 n=1 Tax=Penaeus indicus TaxID=29960 RepID=UPI00300D9991
MTSHGRPPTSTTPHRGRCGPWRRRRPASMTRRKTTARSCRSPRRSSSRPRTTKSPRSTTSSPTATRTPSRATGTENPTFLRQDETHTSMPILITAARRRETAMRTRPMTTSQLSFLTKAWANPTAGPIMRKILQASRSS